MYQHPTPEIEPFICAHMFAHIPICPHVSSSVLARVSPAHWTLVPGWGSTLHVNHQPQHINMGSLKLQHPCPDQIDKNCSRVKGGCGRQVICLQSLAGACLTRAGPKMQKLKKRKTLKTLKNEFQAPGFAYENLDFPYIGQNKKLS